MTRIKDYFARSLTAKIVSGVFVILILGLATVTSVYVVVNGQKGDAVVINNAGKLRMLSQEMAKATYMIATGEDIAYDELRQTAQVFEETFSGVRFGNPELGIPPAPETVQPQLETVSQLWAAFQTDVDVVLEAEHTSIEFQNAVADVKAKNLLLLKEANAAVQLFEKEANTKVSFLFILLGIFLVLDLLAFVVVLRLLRSALRPIRALVEATEQVAHGNLSTTVPVTTRDEIGVLGTSFNAMVSDIRASAEALKAEKASVERKVEEAVAEAESKKQYLARNVDRMLVQIDHFAGGDLTIKLVPERTDDEIAQLFEGFNRAIDNVRNLFSQLHESVDTTLSTAMKIATASEQIAAGAHEQSVQASEVARAVEDMTRTIFENTEHVTQTATVAEQSGIVAASGGEVVEQTVANIRQIAERVGQTAQKVEQLGESSQQISEIASTIEEIAAQTSLLSLNAAIEAARAGEHGKGFAVVADEVRQLAKRTRQATQQIASMIEAIQTETTGAVQSMQEGTQEVQAGIVLADQAGDALVRIVDETHQTVKLINQIAEASQEQAATSEQIAQNVEAISAVSHEAAQGISEIAASTEDLKFGMSQLRALVSHFRVSEDAPAESWADFSEFDIPELRLAA